MSKTYEEVEKCIEDAMDALSNQKKAKVAAIAQELGLCHYLDQLDEMQLGICPLQNRS